MRCRSLPQAGGFVAGEGRHALGVRFQRKGPPKSRPFRVLESPLDLLTGVLLWRRADETKELTGRSFVLAEPAEHKVLCWTYSGSKLTRPRNERRRAPAVPVRCTVQTFPFSPIVNHRPPRGFCSAWDEGHPFYSHHRNFSGFAQSARRRPLYTGENADQQKMTFRRLCGDGERRNSTISRELFRNQLLFIAQISWVLDIPAHDIQCSTIEVRVKGSKRIRDWKTRAKSPNKEESLQEHPDARDVRAGGVGEDPINRMPDEVQPDFNNVNAQAQRSRFRYNLSSDAHRVVTRRCSMARDRGRRPRAGSPACSRRAIPASGSARPSIAAHRDGLPVRDASGGSRNRAMATARKRFW